MICTRKCFQMCCIAIIHSEYTLASGARDLLPCFQLVCASEPQPENSKRELTLYIYMHAGEEEGGRRRKKNRSNILWKDKKEYFA